MRGGGWRRVAFVVVAAFFSSSQSAVHVLHMKIQVGLGGEDRVADETVGDAAVDAHVVVQGVLVGVPPLADLTDEPLWPAPHTSI